MAASSSPAAAALRNASNTPATSANDFTNTALLVIEPLNRYDAPGYFLTTTEQARTIINTVDATNLRLMFDCYHVQLGR
jgi:hydroxypyruvate isomerase